MHVSMDLWGEASVLPVVESLVPAGLFDAMLISSSSSAWTDTPCMHGPFLAAGRLS